MIIIPELRLGYQHIPKVATTSMFRWLYTLCQENCSLSEESKINPGNVRQFFIKKDSEVATLVDNTAENISQYEDFYRFAITRDPVKRFISMYSNRVVHHRELSSQAKCAERLEQSDLQFDPEINHLISNLDEYFNCAAIIKHHSVSLMNRLGPDLTVFSRIADISQIDDVLSEIGSFWQSNGLEISPQKVERLQTGGPKLALNALSNDSFERLLEYYAEDYENVPTVSIENIKEEYKKSCDSGESNPTIEFRNIEKSMISVIEDQTDLVDFFKIWPLNKVAITESPVTLIGIVLIGSSFKQENWELFWVEDGVEQKLKWKLPSPKIAEKFTSHPFAANARFKLDDVQLKPDVPVDIMLRNIDGEQHRVAQLQLRK